MDKFLYDFPQMAIVKKIRLIELFGGIGSQAMALRDLGVDFENWRLVEFDPFAIKSYNAIHGTNFKPSDIRNIHGKDLNITETDKYCYLMTYSFPCQDLSVAGKQKGMTKGSETRSGLLWEVERILNELPNEQLPEVLLMENVPQVHSKKNKADFDAWLSFLSSKGYSNFWKDLNAKDYGIPQNRNRCFMLSLLGDYDFEFPDAIKLERTILSCLEPSVPEKFYINTPKAKELIQNYLDKKKDYKVAECIGGIGEKKSNGGTQFYQQDRVYAGDIALAHPAGLSGGSYKYIVAQRGRVGQQLEANQTGTTNALTTVQKDNLLLEVVPVGNVNPSGNGINGGVISAEGLAPTIRAELKGLKVVNGFYKQALETAEKGNAKPGDIIDAFNGKVNKSGVSPKITTRPEGKKTAILPVVRGELDGWRIRKLTPRECWRLMGYTDDDFDKAAAVNSNTQLYKQAGNAIVKQVLMAIFSQMNIKGVTPWNKRK